MPFMLGLAKKVARFHGKASKGDVAAREVAPRELAPREVAAANGAATRRPILIAAGNRTVRCVAQLVFAGPCTS
jgi:hypothetical protein